jgi:hypothetical protein
MVQMTDGNGNVMDSVTVQGNNFARLGDQTVQCDGSVGGWDDGFFVVSLTAPYDQSKGDVTVRLTNTLDQGAGDESIGYGDMHFEYEFNDGRPETTGNYDAGEIDPTSLWENNCGATRKTCNTDQYYGGYNECGSGAQFWRNFERTRMHPGTHRVTFEGRIWTIDSWDGETFTVEMKNDQGTVMDSVQVRGNNFEGVADVTLSCEGSVGGWQDGYFDVMLTSNYDQNMGDV